MTVEPMDPTRSGAPLFADASGAVSLSLNEVETLCLKAARGAGMSWGHAEEAGFAAVWLAARGIDGASALCAHLDRAGGSVWRDLSPVVACGDWRAPGAGPLCPIATGAALGDFADLPEGAMQIGPLVVAAVSRPLLLLPFLAAIAARHGAPVRLIWDGRAVHLDSQGEIAGDIDALAALDTGSLRLTAAPSGAAAAPGPAPAPPAIPNRTIERLNALAMKTTVPPSEQSRSGAGAATDDND